MSNYLRATLFSLMAVGLMACTQEQPPDPAQFSPQRGASLTQDGGGAQSRPTTTPSTFLSEPAALDSFEFPSEAIPAWRAFKGSSPPLILLSQAPFLGTVPAPLRDAAGSLVMSAGKDRLQAIATEQIANPVLLPQQSVAAALDAGFFSEVLWVLPHRESDDISLELFRRQMVESGTLWPEEADSLTEQSGRFIGKVRGFPFTACRIDRLPDIEQPSLVHIDLSYYSGRFDNEIKTPLFPLVHSSLEQLRQKKLKVLAATLSYGTRGGGVPLEIRFLGNLIADTVKKPELLDQPLPELLAMRKDGRYMESFFQTDGVLTIYKTMQQIAQSDASIYYDLYRAYWTAKDYEEALKQLDKAIRLDPGYGVEYLHLAIRQLDKKSVEDGMVFLQRMAQLEPDNPFIPLQLAELYLTKGNKTAALATIGKLQQEPWSPVYYPEIPQILAEMKKKAESN